MITKNVVSSRSDKFRSGTALIIKLLRVGVISCVRVVAIPLIRLGICVKFVTIRGRHQVLCISVVSFRYLKRCRLVMRNSRMVLCKVTVIVLV